MCAYVCVAEREQQKERLERAREGHNTHQRELSLRLCYFAYSWPVLFILFYFFQMPSKKKKYNARFPAVSCLQNSLFFLLTINERRKRGLTLGVHWMQHWLVFVVLWCLKFDNFTVFDHSKLEKMGKLMRECLWKLQVWICLEANLDWSTAKSALNATLFFF